MKEGDTHELFNMLMYQHIRRQELIFLQAGKKTGWLARPLARRQR